MAHYGYLIKTGTYPPYKLSKRTYKHPKNAQAAALRFVKRYFPDYQRIIHIEFGEQGELPLLDYKYEQNRIHYEEHLAKERSRWMLPMRDGVTNEKGFFETLHEDKNSLITVIAIAAFAIISMGMIISHLYNNGILHQFNR